MATIVQRSGETQIRLRSVPLRVNPATSGEDRRTLKTNTSASPPKNAAVPRSLSLRAKNAAVRTGPIRHVTPARKRTLGWGGRGNGSQPWAMLLGEGGAQREEGRTFPSASRAPSKKRTTPNICSQQRRAKSERRGPASRGRAGGPGRASQMPCSPRRSLREGCSNPEEGQLGHLRAVRGGRADSGCR